MTNPVPISVGIPACHRTEKLHATLTRIAACSPAPDEILVHLDGNDPELRQTLEKDFPSVRLLASTMKKGPGGSRDVLIRNALHDWVATFDDDSYPDHHDYFARVKEDILQYPKAAVFSSGYLPLESRIGKPQEVAVFSGCGCVYNKAWYLRTSGYVPRVVAYGLEEVDLSLQLHALGGVILLDPGLNVLHDHPITGPFPQEVVSGTIVNAFLFPWVRYPLVLLPLGFAQAMRYAVKAAFTGAGKALLKAFNELWTALPQHRVLRKPVSTRAVLSWLKLRRSTELSKTSSA